MPESSSHGSCLQNCRLRSLRLFVLTSCIALSISPPVRAQAKSAAHKQVEQLVEEKPSNSTRSPESRGKRRRSLTLLYETKGDSVCLYLALLHRHRS